MRLREHSNTIEALNATSFQSDEKVMAGAKSENQWLQKKGLECIQDELTEYMITHKLI